MDIADAVAEVQRRIINQLHTVGTVTGTSGTRVIVTVNGGSLTLPRLTSYTPTTGDVVQIIGPPGARLVIGKTA